MSTSEVPGGRLIEATEHVFEVLDEEFDDLGIRATLDARGVFRFWIETRLDRLSPEHGRAYGNVRAKQLFAAALAHFGSRVTCIRAEWYYGDNLAVFDRLVRVDGISPADAALATWTGRQAATHGFSVARIVTAKGHPTSKRPYKKVLVDFTR